MDMMPSERKREFTARIDSSKSFLQTLEIFADFADLTGLPPTVAEFRNRYYERFKFFLPRSNVYRWMRRLELIGALRSTDDRPYVLTLVGKYLARFNLADFQKSLRSWLNGANYRLDDLNKDVGTLEEKGFTAEQQAAIAILSKQPTPDIYYEGNEKAIFEYGYRMIQNKLKSILGDDKHE
jgi:hypothetical protein